MVNSLTIEGRINGSSFKKALEEVINGIEKRGFIIVGYFAIRPYSNLVTADDNIKFAYKWEYQAEVKTNECFND